MPNKLPAIKSKKILKILFKLGFQVRRKKGSHVILYKGRKMVVVPVHKSRDIRRGTLANIIKCIGLTKAKFLEKLNN